MNTDIEGNHYEIFHTVKDDKLIIIKDGNESKEFSRLN